MLPKAVQQLRVTAIDAWPPAVRDDWGRLRFRRADIVTTTPRGLMEASDVPAKRRFLVRYLRSGDDLPDRLPGRIRRPSGLRRRNFVDSTSATSWSGWSPPSGAGRRFHGFCGVSLDMIGTLPRQSRRKVSAGSTPDKRSRLIDELLRRPEILRLLGDENGPTFCGPIRQDHAAGNVGMTRWAADAIRIQSAV